MKIRDKLEYSWVLARQNAGKLFFMSTIIIFILVINVTLLSVPTTIKYQLEKDIATGYHKNGIVVDIQSQNLRMTVNDVENIVLAMENHQMQEIFTAFKLPTGVDEIQLVAGDFKNLKLEQGNQPTKESISNNDAWVTQDIYNEFVKNGLLDGMEFGKQVQIQIILGATQKTIKFNFQGVANGKEVATVYSGLGSAISQKIVNPNSLKYVVSLAADSIEGLDKEIKDIINNVSASVSDMSVNTTATEKLHEEKLGMNKRVILHYSIVSPIVLMLMLFLCFTFVNTFNVIINRNRYTVGIYRAIGLNKTQLATILMIIAVVIIVLTVPIAFGLSFALGGFVKILSSILYGMFTGNIDLSVASSMTLVVSPLLMPILMGIISVLACLIILVKLAKFNDKKILAILARAQ